jgi:hypothetical protein
MGTLSMVMVAILLVLLRLDTIVQGEVNSQQINAMKFAVMVLTTEIMNVMMQTLLMVMAVTQIVTSSNNGIALEEIQQLEIFASFCHSLYL